MNLLNMTNSTQIHEFYKKAKQEIFIFQRMFSNLVIYYRNLSCKKVQNFSSISPKLCQITQGHSCEYYYNNTCLFLHTHSIFTTGVCKLTLSDHGFTSLPYKTIYT